MLVSLPIASIKGRQILFGINEVGQPIRSCFSSLPASTTYNMTDDKLSPCSSLDEEQVSLLRNRPTGSKTLKKLIRWFTTSLLGVMLVLLAYFVCHEFFIQHPFSSSVVAKKKSVDSIHQATTTPEGTTTTTTTTTRMSQPQQMHLQSPLHKMQVVPSVSSTKNSSQLSQVQKIPAVRFVFTIGIEGTGHHLIQSMAIHKQSPVLKQLQDANIYPELTRRMSQLLYDGKLKRPTLWGSMTCGNEKMATVEDELVQVLQTIATKAENAPTSTTATGQEEEEQQQETTLTVPFNTLNTFGSMVSYPHFTNACRRLEYPDLDLWYKVCDRANVTCEHIYIYRDPYEVLYSTTIKRKFNRNKPTLSTIHLYKSMLKIIYAQIAEHSSRTIGCFGMFERDNNVTSLQSKIDSWKYPLGSILGWTNKTAYDAFFAKMYKPPSAGSNSSKYREPFEKPKHALALQSFVTTNNRVVQLCESVVRQNNIPPPSMLITLGGQ